MTDIIFLALHFLPYEKLQKDHQYIEKYTFTIKKLRIYKSNTYGF